MKFFIPNVADPTEAEEHYNELKAQTETTIRRRLRNDRIYIVNYGRPGVKNGIVATVGDDDELGRTIQAIFKDDRGDFWLVSENGRPLSVAYTRDGTVNITGTTPFEYEGR